MNRRLVGWGIIFALAILSPARPADADGPYLILTARSFLPRLSKLIDLKEAQGYLVDTLLIEDIRAGVSGRDDQEKIRNAVAARCRQNGYGHLLIGGDIGLIPARTMVSPLFDDYSAELREPLTTDYYYAALDGNFDANGNARFGERSGDNVDVYPELAVGRLPFQNDAEADLMVRKIVDFQMGRQTIGYDRAIFAYQFDSRDRYTHFGAIGEVILNNYYPAGMGRLKLYTPTSPQPFPYDRPLTHENSLAALNDGYQAAFHTAHSEWMHLGDFVVNQGFVDENIHRLTNVLKCAYVNSCGCRPGRLDNANSVAKQILRYGVKDGGIFGSDENVPSRMVGFTGNSGMGRYTPGTAVVPYHYSPAYQVEMSRAIYVDRQSIGEAHQTALLKFGAAATADHTYLYQQYTLVTYGDPALRLFAGRPPQTLAGTVEQNFNGFTGRRTFDVAVTTADGRAVERAGVLVKIPTLGWRRRGWTDASGRVGFDLPPGHADLTVSMIVWKHDFSGVEKSFDLPFVRTIDTPLWQSKSPMARARSYTAGAALNGKVYVVGGWAPGTFGIMGYIEEFNPATNAWTPLNQLTAMPTMRQKLAAASLNGEVFAIGGANAAGIALDVVESYRPPPANLWTTRRKLPTARHSLAAAVIGGKLYAVGGMTTSVNLISASLDEYDPAKDAWVSRALMRTPRYGAGAAVLNDLLYVAGGNTLTGTSNVVEAYNPKLNAWMDTVGLPLHLKYLSLAAMNGRLYAMGGSDDAGRSRIGVYCFDPKSSTPQWKDKEDLQVGRDAMGSVTVAGSEMNLPGQAWPDMIYVMGGHAIEPSLSGVLNVSVTNRTDMFGATPPRLSWTF